MDSEFTIRLAGLSVRVRLHHAENERFFEKFLTEPCADAPLAEVTPEELAAVLPQYPEGTLPAYAECSELASRVSAALLPHGSCIFHGVAFLWRGKAWIYTAPPGTGKTTQYVLWKRRYGDEVGILNGDKPVLTFSDEGVIVSPSPWCGKEGMQVFRSAPLGGIVYLRQARENRMLRLAPARVLQALLHQFLLPEHNSEALCQALPLLERLLDSVPVWALANRGDEASAVLCHDVIEQFLEVDHALSDS